MKAEQRESNPLAGPTCAGVSLRELKIVIKGAGEMATGIAHRLAMAHVGHIVMTEIPQPLTVRRTVAFSEAVYDGTAEVEGVRAKLIRTPDELPRLWGLREIGVVVDPQWSLAGRVKPHVVVDAIMAKRNTGTTRDEAQFVIGVGPGFSAPGDVHAVIESNRGHDLGRVIYEGSAEPHTGIPGDTKGFTVERVLRSPHEGKVRHAAEIGRLVHKGDLILYVDDTPVYAPIDGMLRGLIREISVDTNEKIGDIDPRGAKASCVTITEKARAIGGGVLEAILHYWN